LNDFGVEMTEIPTTSRRIAGILRRQILSGSLAPGTPLRESALSAQLGVARNTLRHAFQQLSIEGLTEYKIYKGTIVRRIDEEQVVDIYITRRTLELRAIAGSSGSQSRFKELHRAIQSEEKAAKLQSWSEVGTASLMFHQAIVGLLGSRMLNEFFEILAAQLRLAFFEFRNEATFQAPWITRDRQLCDLICSGHRREAETAMAAYLDESERMLLQVLRVTEQMSPRSRRLRIAS
jgi:DNA-binding GntR family transcriptional regulator